MAELVFLLVALRGILLLRLAVEGLDRLVGRDTDVEPLAEDRR